MRGRCAGRGVGSYSFQLIAFSFQLSGELGLFDFGVRIGGSGWWGGVYDKRFLHPARPGLRARVDGGGAGY